MVKDCKYIIKRIIIGVGIALALMFIKGNILIGVQAKELSSTNWGYQYQGIDTNSSASQFTITGNPWANWRLGTLYFSVAVTKSAGSATDPVLGVRAIHAISDNTVYTCYFGANTSANSTWTESTYSVQCPMDLGWPGVTRIDIIFNPISQQTASQYIITLDTFATFEQDDSISVNVDTSSTTTAINSQITNDNTNTTNIINNQNQNTQQQIESQKVCNNITIDKNLPGVVVGGLNSNGTINNSITNYVTSDFLLINSESTLTVTSVYNYPNGRGCFYDSNKNVISCFTNYDIGLNNNVPIPVNAFYIKVAINTEVNKPTYLFKYCKNGNQAIADSQQQINDSITSTEGVSDSDISDLFADFESSDSPITDLLTMPLTLIQAYISGMSGTCQSISLGRLYGTNLIIPCIDIESRLGSNLWTMIDILCAMFIVYNLSQLFITAFDSITSLKDNFSWLYGVEGKHIGAPSTRVERNSDLY